MDREFAIRPAEAADAPAMAKVHVEAWRETYRGVMSDAVLDDPGLLVWREAFWAAALTDPRYAENTAVVAVHDDAVIGIAMSGPEPGRPAGERRLHLLYVYASFHGSGAGAALLEAVLDPRDAVTLWVADPNPRAQAFYRKHGFVADGSEKTEDGVREIRLVRRLQR